MLILIDILEAGSSVIEYIRLSEHPLPVGEHPHSNLLLECHSDERSGFTEKGFSAIIKKVS